MDIRLFALINLIVQIGLVAMLVYAGYLARKKSLKKHCTVMRIAVSIQIVAVAAVMAPSLLGYTTTQSLVLWFYIEMVLHALLGLSIIGIWVFVNLAQTGVIKVRGRLQSTMRAAFVLWTITFALGVHIYLSIWL